jgi:hypothetical protein
MRFSLKHHGQLSCVEHCPEGEYVLHSDYARLKAEVERLTKAGDELWEFAKLADTNAHKARRKALKDWHAAKEGKPRA